MVKYAAIDKNNVLIGIRELSNTIESQENIIEVSPEFNFNLGSVKWNGESWESYTPPEPPEPEPTMEEQILSGVNNTNESQLILMDALAYQYETNMKNDLNNKEVLATIYEELLAQKEVK